MYWLGDFQLTNDKFIIHERPGHFTKFNKLIRDIINLFFSLRQTEAGPSGAALQKAANYTFSSC